MAGGDPSAYKTDKGPKSLKQAKGDLCKTAPLSRRSRQKAAKKWRRQLPIKGNGISTDKSKIMDASFFNTMDPEKNSMDKSQPNALYAASRSFVIDSGASFHLIGYNQLTPKEKGSVRTIAEPFRIQSANGTVVVDKEVQIFVPALNASVWAQLMDNCPAVLSLGILCSKQGWNYEWRFGHNPTLSKGTRRITLTPHHDVPMVFAARLGQGVTPCSEDDGDVHDPAARSSGEGRPSAVNEAQKASDIADEGQPSQAGEGRPCAPGQPSHTGEGRPCAPLVEDEPKIATRQKGKQRQKQRIVKSKFSVPPSARHNKFTHFPLDKNCEICKLVKCTRAACKAGTVPERDGLPPATQFGDRLTADHKSLADDQSARNGARYALIIQDEYTKWIQAYATKTRSHEEVVLAFSRFMPLNTKPRHVYVDNAPELLKALEEMRWNHDTSTPHRPETNGVAERAVRRVKEGTSAILLQSGLTEEWWQEAMACYCFLRCVHDKIAGNQTAFEKRFGQSFKGPIIPFGAQIEYKPSQQSDVQKLHQFGKKMLAGIFLGYVQHAGGVDR